MKKWAGHPKRIIRSVQRLNGLIGDGAGGIGQCNQLFQQTGLSQTLAREIELRQEAGSFTFYRPFDSIG
jgi:hypothetical protein